MFGLGRKKKEVGAHRASAQEPGQAKSPAEQEAQEEVQQATTKQESSPEPTQDFDRSQGPWDQSEVKTGSDYIDLGSILVKSNPGLSLRLEADQKSQQIIAITLQIEDGTLQVQAFAAPKSRGLWEEIRKDLTQSIKEQKGRVEVTDGPLGRQLISQVPATTPDGRPGLRIARFVGVDGPRWFLRGVFAGSAVTPGPTAAALEEAFRELVIHRGSNPLPPRDLLPLRIPQAFQEAAQAQQAEQKKPEPAPQVPRRGPEITEIG